MALSDWTVGDPIAASDDEEGNRVGPFAGVGVLGLDALASASYGPEALLTVLLPLGYGGLSYLRVLIVAIIALLVLVALSYHQTITAYPNGGGVYTVAKENLGKHAALLAAAALALDYILNAAVAVSAGVGALVSAVPRLLPLTLPLCLGVVVLLTLINLRGVRATGIFLLVPTYAFVGLLFIVMGVGLVKTVLSGGAPTPVDPPVAVPVLLDAAPFYLLLRAFANGCTAMTGIEAVSNGIPVFKPPETRNARRTLSLIVGILIFLLMGIALLCHAYGITATPPGQVGYQSVLSQVIAATVGRGPLYYATLASVVAVLAFSANTSFASFPRVCGALADDRFLPERFLHRSRRRAYSHGVIALALVAALLLLVFNGITEGLIPLFAVGALSAFTLSQLGMVGHWRRKRGEPGATRSLLLNGVGATATGITLLIVLISKFENGAWISLLLVAGMLALFSGVRRYYDRVAEAIQSDEKLVLDEPPIVVVPLRRWDAVSIKALRFALATSPDVLAVQILRSDAELESLAERWDDLVSPVRESGHKSPKLILLRCESRQLFRPLLGFLRELAEKEPSRQIAVVLPEFVERRFYHRLFHDRAPALLKALSMLQGSPEVVVITTPWYLGGGARRIPTVPLTPHIVRHKTT